MIYIFFYHFDLLDFYTYSKSMERFINSSNKAMLCSLYSRLGVNCPAPHMLGNELNPESGAAARLQEQLSAELAAHAAGGIGVEPLVPPPLINRAASVSKLDHRLHHQPLSAHCWTLAFPNAIRMLSW